MKRLFMGASALFLLAVPAFAQNTAPAANDPKAAIEAMSKVTTAQDFVSDAAMSDMFEIQTGKMAETQGGNKEIKKLGQTLVKDHTTSSKELMKLAKTAGVMAEPPTALDERHQAIVDSLKNEKGAAFDKAFADVQVQAHQEGIALFKGYSANGDNAELKSFAKKGVPILEKHLKMAEKAGGKPLTQ